MWVIEMNNENRNDNSNIVKPQLVDLNAVQVNNSDNLLSRERDNIVSASIQANQAINKEMATEVNNQIHIDNSINPKKKIVIILSIAILIAGAIGSFVLFSDLLKPEEKIEKTTTTINMNNEFNKHLKDSNSVRKYENDKYVLLILPEKFNSYVLLNKSFISYSSGNVQINDRELLLINPVDSSTNNITIGDTYLTFMDSKLTYNDSEFKYYYDDNELLVINATANMEGAYYINLNSAVSGVSTFIETNTDITLSSGDIFTKTGDNINHNGNTLIQAD